jgi:hypothetical protein
MLLTTFVAALLLTVVILYRELIPLRQEVARLRDEVGELYVVDETKPHAIQAETDNVLEWRWRIWVPKGIKYRVRVYGGLVPAAGFPKDGSTVYLHESGEQVVRYVIRRDPRTNLWNGELRTVGAAVSADEQAWVEWTSRTSTSSGVGQSTKSFEPTETIELIRHRVSQANTSAAIPDPADGFMVWLEPN